MGKLLVLVHTVPPLLAVFDRLVAEMLPGVKWMHILDEPLLEGIRQRGHLAPEDSVRLHAHATLAQQVGASAVLVTCSTVSPSVDGVPPMAIPVMKIDEAMIEQAVAAGAKIGVVATNVTTMEPTKQMLLAQAGRAGKSIQVELVLVENALPALMKGDGVTHDRSVKKAVMDLMGRADVVVLAQASMARVLDVIPEGERRVPVLSSPHLALGRLKDLLDPCTGTRP